MTAHPIVIVDPGAAAVITTNSIRTFFTPLAEKLLRAARWEIDRFHHVRDVFPGDLRKLKASVRELRRLCRTVPDVRA